MSLVDIAASLRLYIALPRDSNSLIDIFCAVRGVMDTVIRVVDEACDRKFNEAQIVKFHGKVCVCLQEVFYEVSCCA